MRLRHIAMRLITKTYDCCAFVDAIDRPAARQAEVGAEHERHPVLRIALGASSGDLYWLIGRQAFGLVAIGTRCRSQVS